MTNPNKTAQRILETSDLFSALNKTDLKKITSALEIRSIKKNEIIFRQNETANGCYVILVGKIQLKRYPAESQEKTTSIRKSGEIFGEMGIIRGNTRTVTAKALTTSKVGLLTLSQFENIANETPEIYKVLSIKLCQKIKSANENVSEITHLYQNFMA